MPRESDARAIALYQAIMIEARSRALSINAITATQASVSKAIIRECCYLQLRMLCELVALGCLVAHGDITNTRYFQKQAYKADDILNALERLHPTFFPHPMVPRFSPGHIHLDEVAADFKYIRKSELITLYGRCGSILHKGNISRLKARPPDIVDFRDVEEWGQKILNLLLAHKISRIGGRIHFITLLNDINGNVAVAIAGLPEDGAV